MRLEAMKVAVVVVAVATLAVVEAAYPSSALDSSSALQVLKRLGLDRGGSIPTVTKAEKLREGDSPIYYIKMPPLPYYYVSTNALQQQHAYSAPVVPFKTIDINFTNNGRPTQVYHWTQHTTKPAFWMPPKTTTTTTTTTTPRPTTTTTSSIRRPTKRPWLTLNKYFPYNGRPSSVYIYKPQPNINVERYKQQYFKHFNY